MLDKRLLSRLHMHLYNKHIAFEGFVFNYSQMDNLEELSNFVYATKVFRQSKLIIDRTTEIYNDLVKLISGDIDDILDEHNRWSEGEIDFDAHQYILSKVRLDTVTDLPESINQFWELLESSRKFSDERDGMMDMFKSIFKNLTKFTIRKDENGENVLVPVESLPEKEQIDMEVNESLSNIDVDHLFDKYDQFYQELLSGIEEEKPFDQIIQLFKNYDKPASNFGPIEG